MLADVFRVLDVEKQEAEAAARFEYDMDREWEDLHGSV